MVATVPAGEHDQLDELAELLRTAGVAAVGSLSSAATGRIPTATSEPASSTS